MHDVHTIGRGGRGLDFIFMMRQGWTHENESHCMIADRSEIVNKPWSNGMPRPGRCRGSGEMTDRMMLRAGARHAPVTISHRAPKEA